MHLKEPSKRRPRLSREEQRLQTQQALRESALREFALRSVAGTSAERIAEAAGYTRGAFYAHFENKQALLLDLIRERIQTEQIAWIELAESHLDLDDLLFTLNERASRFDPSGLWTTIWAETHLYALRDPEFAQQYRQYHELTLRNYMNVLDHIFQRAGRNPPLPLEVLGEALLGMARTPLLPSADQPNGSPRPMPVETFVIFLRALIAVSTPRTQGGTSS